MENAAFNIWKAVALQLDEPIKQVTVPLHVLTGEAVDVASFFQAHWKASEAPLPMPGLEQVAREGLFHAELATEILELQSAVQTAQTQYLLAVSPSGEAPAARAQFVLREIRVTLDFMFDDGVINVDDQRLQRLSEAHRSPTSHDALAAALDDYAGFAELHRDRMSGLGGFDAALIDEARTLAEQLRKRSARKLQATPSERQQALDLRNRLIALLHDRMQRVRAAARFVFRNHPDIVRQATSPYERTRRHTRKRREEREATATPV